MHIQKAFYHAVAHGYRLPGKATHFGGANAEYSVWTLPETQSSFMIPVQETFLDPRFWQSLGQALGWETPCHVYIACSQGDACTVWDGYYWMYQWHCFIQHLADGKTAESFFATLSPARRFPDAHETGPQTSHRSREGLQTLH
jgi:hypothetical protein